MGKDSAARVDKLMSLCDKLEAGLLRSQTDSEKLMEAVVGKMLGGALLQQTASSII